MAAEAAFLANYRARVAIRADTVESRKNLPMQILVLGMCSTGTSSMMIALEKLGYQPFHMAAIFLSAQRHARMHEWQDAIDQTFFRHKPYRRADFDRLLVGYDATTDVPCAIFADQLIAAYPDAKIVLTVRDVENWAKSMRRTIFEIIRWRSFKILRYLDSEFTGPWYTLIHSIFAVHSQGPGKAKYDSHFDEEQYFNEGYKQAYLDHYEHIRNSVPKEKILEFCQPYTWEPLCEFLGVAVPEGEYPRVNDGKAMENRLFTYRRLAIINVAKRFAKLLVSCLVVSAALYGYRIWI